MTPSLQHLPGGDLIEKGLDDLRAEKTTVESCLVKIASPALYRANMLDYISEEPDTEITLYRLLQETSSNPYSTYNSLIRRLISFQKTLHLQLN